jgi:hypothetical protein
MQRRKDEHCRDGEGKGSVGTNDKAGWWRIASAPSTTDRQDHGGMSETVKGGRCDSMRDRGSTRLFAKIVCILC